MEPLKFQHGDIQPLGGSRGFNCISISDEVIGRVFDPDCRLYVVRPPKLWLRFTKVDCASSS